MSMPTVTYHLINQADGSDTACSSQSIAMQVMAELPAGTVVTLERHTVTKAWIGVYGTAQQPLPSAPTSPVTTTSGTVTCTYVAPSLS